MRAGHSRVPDFVRVISIDPPLSSRDVLTKAARLLGMTPRRPAYCIRILNIKAERF